MYGGIMNLLNHISIVFLDTETTHLDVRKSELLSICIWTESRDGKLDKWETKIKPTRLSDADPKALEINGYNKEDWKDAPCFEDVADKIAELLKWGPIVGHNVSFDMRHIKAAFRRLGIELYEDPNTYSDIRWGYPLIDTVSLAWLFLPTDRQNLNACREHLGIDPSRAHSADTDVEDCRELFWHIIDKAYSQR